MSDVLNIMADFINQSMLNPGQFRLIFISVVFVSVMVFLFALIRWINSINAPEKRRVSTIIGHKASQKTDFERYQKALDSATPYVVPKESKDLSKSLKMIVFAGYTNPNAATLLYGTKLFLGLLFSLILYFYLRYLGTLSNWEVTIGMALGAFAGSIIPSKFLERAASKRQDLLRKGFPDALDLLVVSVEAGLGFNAALDRVAKELFVSHPLLASELTTVNDEVRAGIERSEAMMNLYVRTGLEDIQGLTVLIAQSLRFGTSIAESLRIYSEEYRDRRMQKAEEQAAKISTILIFPLVLCIFPSFFLVMIGPPILSVLAMFGR